MDPEAESGKIAIAEDLVPVTGRQSIHDALREGEMLPLRHVLVLPRPASRVLTGRCRRTSTPSPSLSPASPAFAAGNADTIESLDLTVETTEAGPPGWRPDKEPSDYAQSSSGPLSVEKSDPLGQKATAEPVRKRNQTPGGTPDLRGKAAVFLQHELRT